MGAESFPADSTIAGRILELLQRQVQPERPVSMSWLCRHLISRPRYISAAITSLLRGGWLVELEGDPVTYRISSKVDEYLTASRPAWDDDENREWMQHYRSQLIQRIKQEECRGRRT